MHANMSKQDVH